MSDFGRRRCIILYMDRQSAYTKLLRRHRLMVWRMCWMSAKGNWARCNDLVQEVSIAMWLHFDTLRVDATPGEERSWVYWQCRSSLDLQRRLQGPLQQPLTALMVETLASDDSVQEKEEIEHLMAALSPDDQRLVRLHLEGYRADEIAETLGLTRDAVYQRWHRALQKMRSVLAVLLLVAVASGIAIAVVPQWNRAVFHRAEPSTEAEPMPQNQEPERTTKEADTAAVDMLLDTVTPMPLRQPIPLPERLPAFLPSYVDTLPSSLPLKQRVTISVTGSTVIVTGLQGERVTIRSCYGPTLASQECYGIGVFHLFPYDDFFMKGRRAYEIQIGDTLFFDLTL